MQTYNPKDFSEGYTPVFIPAVVLNPSTIVLADKRPGNGYGVTSHKAAAERCLAIYRENGGEDMDFSVPMASITPHFGYVRSVYEKYAARLGSWWLWHVSYPARMWFHFKFHRERPLPGGKRYVEALLRDAFAKEGITDFDLPYPVPASRPWKEEVKQGRFDLFFNGKRVKKA
jgi:hypothetical protein